MYYHHDGVRCPDNVEGYEALMYQWADVSTEQVRAVLQREGVRGRSKMKAADAHSYVREHFPEGYEEAHRASVVRFRWPVAHGLRVSYTELEDIERRAGVVPLKSPGSRGSYASAEDVAAVFEEAARYRDSAHSVRVRVSADDAADQEAAATIVAALSERFECTEPDVYESRENGGRSWYFEARVPRGRGAGVRKEP